MGHLTSTGRVKIVPDMPLSEPDTASTGVAVEIEISLRFDKKYFSIIQGFQL